MAQDSKIQVKPQSDTEKQEAMTFLRERYLYLLSNLCGMGDCKIAMYEKATVECEVKAFDGNFENIIVENLVTPVPPTINKAILRTNDIISIQFNTDYTKLINKF